ncbi:aminoacyl-tRNA hydrolase [Aquiflexum sp. TKW24L]|uniref:alternative ribosome rescue aminoacyl-tRNA hydrolase ArfB n=1 Tax=Aquiflexum sp. TKW24L TaxID=2942212 RepID=UPI0020BE1661|nr:alternative ribosome rescue aminoacyl-tRNA hydrolase ArfB [Aquiflexum sp. TKW24L]MCL6258800.1 aminoacyl-tRNA hydrolase [Aquiflexum sp. TKW24L]
MTISEKIANQVLDAELQFQFSRSSGPGGQNVNKVNSKVELRFNIPNSQILDETEKSTLSEKLSSKIDTEGNLSIQSQEKRSQIQNKEIAVRKFYDLLKKAFQKKKIRKATKPSKGAVEDRLKEKKAQSEKKKGRRGEW